MKPRSRSHRQSRSHFYRLVAYLPTSKASTYIVTMILLFVLLLSSFGNNPVVGATLTRTELEGLVQDVRGDDTRIMRWDASEHTAKRQAEGGCDSLPAALDLLTAKSVLSADEEVKALACEYATFCITDNPVHRAKLASHGQEIHSAIVKLVTSENPQTSAMASHLIYIATFSNAENHQEFFAAGAVAQLSSVLQNGAKEDSKITPVQIMWAAAALQNLAASYCDTKDDGRCYWFWPKSRDHVVLTKESVSMISSGSSVREAILQNLDLIQVLNDYVCHGAVEGEKSDENPFPGDNAETGKHEVSANLIAWAAAGALKNIALEPKAREYIEPALPCLCDLAQSPDWLEENKGNRAIAYLRRDDPCWHEDDGSICVDHPFYDEAGYTCTDYGEATEEECTTVDRLGVSANDACCGCGGGDSDEENDDGDEL
jgi:hypothetical protein